MVTEIKHQIRKIQAEFHIKKLLYPFQEEWFTDKRVALIGGADSVLEKKSGAYIDQFDVVVRINKGVELIEEQSEYVGTRTDVLFHSFLDNPDKVGYSPITQQLWNKHKVQHIIYSRNHNMVEQGIYDIILFAKKTDGSTKFSEIPEKIFRENMRALAPSWPTTGFTAIHTIINCQPKELFVTGITFFKTGHNHKYRPEDIEYFTKNFDNKPKAHNPEKEYQYFKNLYLKHPNVLRPDPTLKEILSH